LVNGANTVSLDSNSNLTFTNGEQIKTNFLGGGIELYQSSDNTIGIYPGGAEIKTFLTGGPKYKWLFGITGNTTFPTGLVLGAPRGVGTVNFTSAIDKEFQIETQTSSTSKLWRFGTDGKLTAPGNLQVDGGKVILNSAGNAYVESVDYGVDSANSALNIFGGPYQKIKLRAGFGTQATWTLGTDGSLTFPNATVQTTAYIAPTTGNSVIDSIAPYTISRNDMTIRVTSTGMIQMSFNSVIYITGRSSINNADSVVISSPNGVTVSGTWYNIGAVLALGDHLTATIVDYSFHRIYRLTVIMREKTTGPDTATAYAIIEQIQ
jgi:hypothetical protein